MKRTSSDSRVAGFSLIEAMATLALTATIILALSSVAGQWLPNWRRGFVNVQRADLLGVA
jgi:general secretion pathway protein J